MAKYRVGVIGCGGIGIRHASGLLGLANVELVAGCDVRQSALENFRKRWEDTWSDVALYTDHREMLEKEDLDVVTVATPDDLHADPVIDAADSGVKGIFCEKPLATSLADADRMMEAIERNNTLMSIDHTRRWMPMWRHVKEVVLGGGEIGQVLYIVGMLGGSRGMLFRNGTHMIDTICYMAESDPEWVFAELEAGYEDYSEYRGDGGYDPKLEPSASGYIHFKNGVRAFYTGTSKKTPPPNWRFEIVGTTGYVFITDKAILCKGGTEELIHPPEWPVSEISAGVQELIKLVDEGGEPVSPIKDAHNVVEVIFGFLESQRQGNARISIPVPRQ